MNFTAVCNSNVTLQDYMEYTTGHTNYILNYRNLEPLYQNAQCKLNNFDRRARRISSAERGPCALISVFKQFPLLSMLMPDRLLHVFIKTPNSISDNPLNESKFTRFGR